ncbi:hypothetical protein F4703DRAFT_1827264 [Phycomyces blakesleeanus]
MNYFTLNEDDEQSTEELLFDYLNSSGSQSSFSELGTLTPCQLSPYEEPQQEWPMSDIVPHNALFTSVMSPVPQPFVDDPICSLLPADSIQLKFNTFSDLQTAIQNVTILTEPQLMSQRRIKRNAKERMLIEKEEADLDKKSRRAIKLPMSVRLTAESSQLLENLIQQAITHWCCIGFKVAPIHLDLIRDWRNAPPTIVYCVASISLVTFIDHHVAHSYIKDAAMEFYSQARQKMDDIFFDSMHPAIIQSYFCLSYTSNLLRLYEQQRTWVSLASIALQQQVKEMTRHNQIDNPTILCWFRWYYVDAWMCLTLNRECLLPDQVPGLDFEMMEQEVLPPAASEMDHCRYNLLQFAILTKYMRKYIRAMRTGTIFNYLPGDDRPYPSTLYYEITDRVKDWYNRQMRISTNHRLPSSHPQTTSSSSPSFCPGIDIHLHLCYNAMRLVVLFQFLHPHQPPARHILIDCLQTNLALLQSLHYLKEVGCDQSTYHHMFFAIHNTAKRIYHYNLGDDKVSTDLKAYACDQLRMNLTLLRGTQAYVNDVFKVRFYAEKIEEQFRNTGISADWLDDPKTAALKASQIGSFMQLPGTLVFRLENNTPTRPRKSPKQSCKITQS